MRLYIGVTKDNELYFIEWDKVNNLQRKTFTLSGGCYGEPVTEQTGETQARERLSESDYWDDLGYIDSKCFLMDFIDFNKVAESVINTDGWENTNGEYSHFGEYNNEEIYLNCSCGGQHQLKRNDFNKLFIGENDFKAINDFWDKEHLKPLKESTIKKMDEIFEHYEKEFLCNDEEVLKKYLEFLEW